MPANYKFMVAGMGWPVGQFLIPASTIIDTTNELDPWRQACRQLLLDHPPPPDAIPLDQATYDAMVLAYDPNRVARVPTT
jgi:hypothetical protein